MSVNLDPQHCLDLWNLRRPMTREQVALVLGCSVSNVEQIERKARGKIRAALQTEWNRQAWRRESVPVLGAAHG